MIPIVTGLLGLAGTFIQGRQKVSEAKAEAKIARVTNGIPGYSDEVLIFVWSAPFVMSFIPPLQPYATQGFGIIETMPEWYLGGFLTITAGVFGFVKFLMFKQKK